MRSATTRRVNGCRSVTVVSNFRSRKLFDTTSKDDRAIAAPAISGFSRPAAAIGIAATRANSRTGSKGAR